MVTETTGDPGADLLDVIGLADGLTGALAGAEHADQEATGDLPGLDLSGIAYLAALIEDTRTHLAAVEQALTARAVTIWDTEHRGRRNAVEIPEVGSIQVRYGKKRTEWAHDDLTKAVIDAHMKSSGGELPDPYTAARWLRDAGQVAYWRVGVLRELGLYVDDYCTAVPGRPAIQLTRTHRAKDGR